MNASNTLHNFAIAIGQTNSVYILQFTRIGTAIFGNANIIFTGQITGHAAWPQVLILSSQGLSIKAMQLLHMLNGVFWGAIYRGYKFL